MNKKILTIGSIIACIIILLASLSPVVGYNTARSSVKDSPLFSVRSLRAIDKQSDRLTCDYIGKGLIFPIPKRNQQIILFENIAENLVKIDDVTLNNLIELIQKQMKHNNILQKVNSQEIISAFYELKNNPERIKNYILSEGKGNDFTIMDGKWNPGCYILFISAVILFIIISILQRVMPTWGDTCFGCPYDFKNEIIQNSLPVKNVDLMNMGDDEPSTFLGGCTIGAWYPGCLIMNTVFYIFVLLIAIYYYFFPPQPP